MNSECSSGADVRHNLALLFVSTQALQLREKFRKSFEQQPLLLFISVRMSPPRMLSSLHPRPLCQCRAAFPRVSSVCLQLCFPPVVQGRIRHVLYCILHDTVSSATFNQQLYLLTTSNQYDKTVHVLGVGQVTCCCRLPTISINLS